MPVHLFIGCFGMLTSYKYKEITFPRFYISTVIGATWQNALNLRATGLAALRVPGSPSAAFSIPLSPQGASFASTILLPDNCWALDSLFHLHWRVDLRDRWPNSRFVGTWNCIDTCCTQGAFRLMLGALHPIFTPINALI